MQIIAATEVEDDYLDSTDHIAYQYSNLIQSHVLFCNVDRQNWEILNVSENAGDWLGISVDDVIGKALTDDLFPGIADVFQKMKSYVALAAQVFSQCVTDREGNPLLCRVSATTTSWLVELELELHVCDVNVEAKQLERLLLEGIESLRCDAPVQEIVANATQKLRTLLGYQRGMCYRFDEENNGEVIAESIASSDDTRYLGLRFPARDIPRTARGMLLASPLRSTLDQRADCHSIFPSRDPRSDEYVDLTHVRGRGAAGSCREYYLNLNIRSTLVLPLIVEDRLWGMLSFHDHQVRRFSAKWDEHLQSFAKCVAISIERRLQTKRDRARKKGLQVVASLSEVDPNSEQWLRYIESHAEDLKGVVPCGGFILRLAGEVLAAGKIPLASDVPHFTDKVCELTQGKPLNTNCLTHLSQDLVKYKEVAAGVIAIPLSASHNDIAIWLRPDQTQKTRWAGDPRGSIDIDLAGSKRLCVRESFEVWSRITENKCLPWNEQEFCSATSAAMQIGLLSLSWHASQANQAKSQFLSCMSHEIRTPMTAILGYSNLLKEQQRTAIQTSQTRDFIDVIERNGMHLLSVIDDILNLAKIEAGKLTVETLSILVPEFLADVVALIKVQSEAKGLDFILELETPIPKNIQSDPVRLRQILLNLLSNAFKFTEQGKVILRVGYDSDSKQIHFSVIDTGIGLTQSQVSRLFNAFTQADSSTTRRFGGSGLGLKISKNLARLLGGDIAVASELGIGSCFRVSVASGCTDSVDLIHQIDNRGSIAKSRTSSGNSEARKRPPSLAGLRIILLEDGEDNQRLLQYILSKAGAEVTVFANGKLGIESLTVDGQLDSPLRTPFPFDMVLTDMQMPELDGYSTTRLLRQKGCNLPVIALTAFAMQGNDSDCIRAGCSDYLSKPLNREGLLEMCAKWSPVCDSTPSV